MNDRVRYNIFRLSLFASKQRNMPRFSVTLAGRDRLLKVIGLMFCSKTSSGDSPHSSALGGVLRFSQWRRNTLSKQSFFIIIIFFFWGGGGSHWSQTMAAPQKKKREREKKKLVSSERSGATGFGLLCYFLLIIIDCALLCLCQSWKPIKHINTKNYRFGILLEPCIVTLYTITH